MSRQAGNNSYRLRASDLTGPRHDIEACQTKDHLEPRKRYRLEPRHLRMVTKSDNLIHERNYYHLVALLRASTQAPRNPWPGNRHMRDNLHLVLVCFKSSFGRRSPDSRFSSVDALKNQKHRRTCTESAHPRPNGRTQTDFHKRTLIFVQSNPVAKQLPESTHTTTATANKFIQSTPKSHNKYFNLGQMGGNPLVCQIGTVFGFSSVYFGCVGGIRERVRTQCIVGNSLGCFGCTCWGAFARPEKCTFCACPSVLLMCCGIEVMYVCGLATCSRIKT